MLPHPETVRKITALHDQERLRDIAQQRRATSPNARARSRPTRAGSAWLAGGSWLTGWMTHLRRATRVHGTGAWRRALSASGGLMLPAAGSRRSHERNSPNDSWFRERTSLL